MESATTANHSAGARDAWVWRSATAGLGGSHRRERDALSFGRAIGEEAHIPYAIAGAMALNEYGYRRVTTDVDVLLTKEGLADLKSLILGRGYLEKFPGSKGFRDTEHGVNIDVRLAGDYPGDGQPKPVVFPDPARVALRGDRGAFLPLATLIELKLASGMTAPHRLKDLADVLELVRAAQLPDTLRDELEPSVRLQYDELWKAAQTKDDE